MLANQYLDDLLLQRYLEFRMPRDILSTLAPLLTEFGGRAAGEFYALENAAERDPPRHVPYTPWGERTDEIVVAPAWKEFAAVSAREGLVAIGYERREGEFSRVHQFAKLYLFHPSSAFFSCPLAMTDGAAKLIEVHGDRALRAGAFRHLTARDPAEFWTSGQWMTERAGGSDVGGTSTVARPLGDGFELSGTKWFSSATTSEMAIALARIEGDAAGSRGLSAFYLETRGADGRLNGIRVNRLKDKLGTHALPTAELTLAGTKARLVGARGQGVATIASLFNVTRMYNAVCALGTIRRAYALARDYAEKREAFGKKLLAHPLHAETLAELALAHAAAFHLTFHLVYLLGKEEVGKASAEEKALLRLLTPIAKLFTGKEAVRVVSEAIECIGGAAYVEDTGLPRLLRNAQVFPIWEGTTNILSLDVLRAIERENAFPAFAADVETRLAGVRTKELAGPRARVADGLARLTGFLKRAQAEGVEFLQAGGRAFAFGLARVYAGALLLEFAEHERKSGAAGAANLALASAERWCAGELASLVDANQAHRRDTASLLGM